MVLDYDLNENENTNNNVDLNNTKRCGVIFVDISDRSWEWRKYNNYNQYVVSFIVVKGRYSDIWSLPKGRITNDKESEEDCAIREVYEETGIKLKTIAGLPRIVIGKNVYFIYHTSKKEINNFIIHDDYEVSEVSWKTIDELRNLKFNKDIRALLKYPVKVYPFHKLIYRKSISRSSSLYIDELPDKNIMRL